MAESKRFHNENEKKDSLNMNQDPNSHRFYVYNSFELKQPLFDGRNLNLHNKIYIYSTLILGTGELYLDSIMKDLRELYSEVEVKVIYCFPYSVILFLSITFVLFFIKGKVVPLLKTILSFAFSGSRSCCLIL